MANNLFILGLLFDNAYFSATAKKMTFTILETIDYASAFSHWLLAYLKMDKSFTEISIIGSESIQWNKEIQSLFLPNAFTSGSDKTSELPYLKNYNLNEKTNLFICFDKKCLAPLQNISDFSKSYKNINK